MDDRGFMLKTLAMARKGIRSGQTPFGACIVYRNKVIALAHNVVWKCTDPSAHAEVHAIRLACKRLKRIHLSGCTLYSSCEPCPMCFSACHWAGLDRIVYGTAIRDAARIGFRELDISNRKIKQLGKSPLKITGPFMRKESLRVFEEFAKVSRGKLY